MSEVRPTVEDLKRRAKTASAPAEAPDARTQTWKEDQKKQEGEARLRSLNQDIDQRKLYARSSSFSSVSGSRPSS